MKFKNPREISPVEVFFSFVDGRLRGAIIWYLAQGGSMRYSELAKSLPKTNPKLLVQQLRTMEQDGLIERTVFHESTPRVEYSLTEFGRSTFPVLQGAHLWALNYVKNLPPEVAPITDDMRPIYKGKDAARQAQREKNAAEQGGFGARDHAILFALIARSLVRHFGNRGEKAVRAAVRKYGLQRGRRMALRTLRDGLEPNVMNYLAYGEWIPDPAERDTRFPAYEPEVRMENYRCPWHRSWQESDLMEYGRLYCQEVDAALAQGYNGMTLDLQTNLAAGDPFCGFVFRGCGLTPEQEAELEQRRKALGNSAKMPWLYHLGHLLRAMEDTARDIFGQSGVDAVSEAMKEYADTFGTEAAGQIRESSRQDFDSLPPEDAEQ